VSLLPLTGRRVLVTRALHQAGKLSQGLRALGAEAVEVPVLEIRPPVNLEPLDAAIRNLDGYDWLILTSANTVRALADRAAELRIGLSQPALLKVAAVGEATAEAAHKAGFETAFVPEAYIAESLVEGLLAGFRNAASPATKKTDTEGGGGFNPRITPAESKWALHAAEKVDTEGGGGFNPRITPAESTPALAAEGHHPLISPEIPSFSAASPAKRVLLARAAVARDVIPDALRAAGAQVDVVDAYRNVLPEAAPGQLRQALVQGIDAATFTSSSSVTHLADAAQQAGIPFPFTGVPAISIGPITSRTLRDFGWEPALEANPSDIPGLIAAAFELLRR
jgi:uroporphyrinogen-III synthase